MERNLRFPTVAGVLFAALVPCAATAQEFVATPSHEAHLVPGARVRVKVASALVRQEGSPASVPLRQEIVGNLLTLDESRVTIRVDSVSDAVVPRTAVERLEVSRGHRSRGHAAVIGALAGGVVFGIAGASYKPTSSGSRSAGALAVGCLGLGPGALVGFAVGGGERWEVVKLDKVKVGLAPNRQGPGVSIAVGF